MTELLPPIDRSDAADLPDDAGSERDVLSSLLEALRIHLSMDAAYLATHQDGRIRIEAGDEAPGTGLMWRIDRGDLSDGFCAPVMSGMIDGLVTDTHSEAKVADLGLIRSAGIRAFLAIPVMRPGGLDPAMLCCVHRTRRPDLSERDYTTMSAFAAIAGDLMHRRRASDKERIKKRAEIHSIIENLRFDIVFQPIFDLNSGEMRGVEALTRFAHEDGRGPDLWIADAGTVGLQAELESAIVGEVLDQREQLPRTGYLSVNVSPATLVHPSFAEALRGHDTLGLILELTEHVEIPEEAALEAAIARLRNLGIKLAIDDVGSGYSGLSQILRFRPDFLKLDMSLVSGLESDAAKRSLAMAMQHFGREIGAKLIAEGIEKEEEAYALRMLGISLGQGFHLGRPSPAKDLAVG